MKSVGPLVIPVALLFAACAATTLSPRAASVPPTTQFDTATPSGRQALIAQLKQAELADKMDSMSWTDSNASLDIAWHQKQEEVQNVIARLESGERVPNEEIRRALDNSLPHRLGGYPN
jgi:hypothetical protein